MEYEDKHSLEGVEYGEEVRHDNGGLADEEEAEGPCETQQAQQGERTHDPGSKQTNTRRGQIQCERRSVDRGVAGILNHLN